MKRIERYRRRKRAERKVRGIVLFLCLILGGSIPLLGGFCGSKQENCLGDVEFRVAEPLGDKLYGEISMIRVEPGQKLAKDPTIFIEEYSEVSYLRVRILWGGLSGQMRKVLEENLALKKGWIKNQNDGFYYYQYPVEGGDEICFFDMLTVPENWTESQVEVSFCMKLHVEAADTEYIEVLHNQEREINGWIIL